MEALKKERKRKLEVFHDDKKTLEDELNQDPLDYDNIEDLIEIIKESSREVEQADKDVISKAVSSKKSNEEILDEEKIAAEHRRERTRILNKAKRVLDQRPGSEQANNNGSSTSSRRLPKLELPKFGGDARDWLPYWSQFEEIHLDSSIPDADKFQYLIQSTKEGSDAREAVMSFPVSAQNYKLAVDQLQKMFGRDKMLVKVYVRDLLQLVIDNAQNKTVGLQSLYFRLSAKIKALETLGVTTDKCASVVYPLVESCLPEDVLRAWQRSPICQGAAEGEEELLKLIEFLEKEVGSENNIRLACTGLRQVKLDGEKRKVNDKNDKKSPATAAALVSADSTSKANCIFCEKGNHQSDVCSKASDMQYEDKIKIIKEKRACFKCLKRGHSSKQCKGYVKCVVCSKKHASVMCPEKPSNQRAEGKQNEKDEKVESSSQVVSQECTNHFNSPEVLLQTIQVKIKGKDRVITTRAMFDSGSQRSYVTKEIAEQLSLEQMGEEEVIHGLFGGITTKPEVHNIYKVEVLNLNETHSAKFNVSDKQKITGEIKKVPFGPWIKPLKENGIWINDMGEGASDIGLLIGCDVYAKLITGKKLEIQGGPVAVQTLFGWTLMGKLLNKPRTGIDSSQLVHDLHVVSEDVSKLWELDTIGITDPTQRKTAKELEEDAMRHFNETVKILENGRYEVHLPWISGHPLLNDNKKLAMRRLNGCTANLKKKNAFEDYDKLFKMWEEKGFIERVPNEETTTAVNYLPHHAVLKPTSSTTPVRPVFDASSKEPGKPSLNDCLEKGPNLIEVIPAVTTRFRMDTVGVTADIAKAFQQISVTPKDRNFLRFLWWANEKCENLVEFRHCRVVFGVNASPFLLGAVIQDILKKASPNTKATAQLLLKSLYVDNVAASVHSMKEAEEFQRQAHQLLLPHQMELRCWEFGPHTEDKEVPLLGLLWNIKEDNLKLDMRQALKKNDVKITKRNILALAHTIFDPLGFTSPFTLLPKLLLQECCVKKVGWDEEIKDENLIKKFAAWRESFPVAQKLEVPRYIVSGGKTHELHVFVDATKWAYAAVAFLRTVGDNKVSVQLVQAKSRVSPQKNMTIPRLELLACTIGARLAGVIEETLSPKIATIYFWSDSTAALYWIREPSGLGVFARNRVEEIRKLSDVHQWRHIKGDLNPADLPSRGCSMQNLIKSRWWEGPSWLKLNKEEWPKSEAVPDMEEVKAELLKKVTSATSNKASDIWLELNKTEDYDKILDTVMKYYKINGMKRTEIHLIKLLQQNEFDGIKDARLKNIPVYRDDEGVIRLKSRLDYTDQSEEFKNPAVMPTGGAIVKALIMHEHKINSHAGAQTLLVILRERFWILKGRIAIKKALKSCLECRRFNAKPICTGPAALPRERVQAEIPFQYIGIDLAGPLYLKDESKAWIVLFTCGVFRAIHLELVLTLSVDGFKDALRRFIARRGRPSIIWTDNGTNLAGCNNAFKKINWKKIERYGQFRQIKWKHIPPTGAWWGGWWERMVGVVKATLRRVLGKASLNYQELETVLCDAEATINKRPLTYVSGEATDMEPLTPFLFITGNKNAELPEADEIDGSGLRKRYEYMQKLRNHFRSRFAKEYLGQLRLSPPKRLTRALKVGELVLIGHDGAKRIDWPLGRIVELIPGRDGVVRVVKVKAGDSVFTRPIQRIYPLEGDLYQDDEQDKEEKVVSPPDKIVQEIGVEAEETKGSFTRSGRKINLPVRLSYIFID